MNLNDILYDFNPNHNWVETREQIAGAVLDYNEAIAVGDGNPGGFLYGCLPVYWQIVRQHNTHQWGGVNRLPSNSQYDVGIFLVGFSSLPVVLSIAEIQPRREIYFLHSPETRHKCDEITARITEMLETPPDGFDPLTADAEALIGRVQNAERCEIENPSDPVEIFKQIKKIIDGLECDTNIALDLTGGKKTMIGGGFTAGSIYSLSPKCDMFYVDSSEYDPDRGAPIPSTEFLSQLDNPYDVYNVQSVQEAKALFKGHNYEVADRLWDSVRDKLDLHAERYHFLEDERKEAKEYYGSSHCYHPWDAFDYNGAKNRKMYRKDGRKYLWGYHDAHTYGNIDVLDILSEVQNKASLFACDARVIHYAVDRYQNGRRRMGSGKFEDAIVRFAQVIEMLCIYKICQIARDGFLFNEQNNRVDNAPHKWNITPLIRFLFGETCNYDRWQGQFYTISDCNQLLNVTDYGCNHVSEIINLIESRNDFIHFNSPMKQEETKKNAENLQNLARAFLENLSSAYREAACLSFDKLLELHKFRQLK